MDQWAKDKWAELVLKCNRYTKMMFPNNALQVPSDQHRTMVRTYVAGALDGFLIVETREALILDRAFLEFVKPMVDYNWWPGDEWDYRKIVL